MIKHKKSIIAVVSLIVALLVAATVILIFFPKLYTNPDSINDFNVCKQVGYPITPGGPFGGETCTLPNGRAIYNNFG